MDHQISPSQLKQLRKRLGYTQREIGDQLGVSECTVGRWERGKLAFTRQTVLACLYLWNQKKAQAIKKAPVMGPQK